MYGLIGSATTDLGRTSSLSSHTAGKNPGSAANIFASSLSSDSSEESYKCLPNIHRNPQKKSFTRACKGYKDLVKFISHRVVHRFGECASGCYGCGCLRSHCACMLSKGFIDAHPLLQLTSGKVGI